ncbi:MAG: hypothetical protein WC455_18900 [Dehalococcoidia bacterium]|jgi:hypothetical protein
MSLILSEKPCLKCDLSGYCYPETHQGQTVRDPRQDACGPYARYLGQQEGQSERDALRAEVEILRRVVEELADGVPCHRCPGKQGIDAPTDPCPPCDETCASRIIKVVSGWAISEARKDKEGEG